MNNKNKMCAILWYIAAVGEFIAAIVCFVGPVKYLGGMNLCISSLMLCIGSGYLSKFKKEQNNKKTTENRD